ncbi:hypothetical protein BKA69DRAFT_1104230 [Paraphysoderma sedebokerense]|nr:hypothetical protein BKA69DRAFT_1104230 [Paraphysoderma sedebokerense]
MSDTESTIQGLTSQVEELKAVIAEIKSERVQAAAPSDNQTESIIAENEDLKVQLAKAHYR